MKTIFNRTWIGNLINTEEVTLRQLDGYNKTRYSRRKNKEGLLELASREAHERQKVYFATILKDDDSPYCAIESNVGYFGLDFLRDNYDDYLTFQYREQLNQDGKLFLTAIFLFECYPGTDKRMRRIDFTYTHEGGCSSVIYQGEAYDGTFEMITTEHPSISAEELELLWVDYPKFGEYDQLIRLDRIPKGALERILEYTDKEFPEFRQYLQRDIERYQEPKKWIWVRCWSSIRCVPSSTQLYKVSDETAIRYLKELKDKYAPGSVIADVPSNIRGANAGIFEANQGRELRGQMILEVPEQEAKISPKVLDYAKNHNIKIRDIKGKSYN